MMYRDILAVCTEIHKNYINALRRKNTKFLKLHLAVHNQAACLWSVNVINRKFVFEKIKYPH